MYSLPALNRVTRMWTATAAACLLASGIVWAQPPAAEQSASQAPDLSLSQQQVADRFKKLEELLLRSAELEATENPTRSALLQQAAQMGKSAQLSDLLARAANRLEKKQYSQAIEDQKSSRESLKRLLELLQSENREERVRQQRDQVRRWIEETDRLLRMQKSLSGRTEGGQEFKQASNDQSQLAKKAAEIAKDLGAGQENDTNAADSDKAKEPSDNQDQPGNDPSNDAKPSDTNKDSQDPSKPQSPDAKPSDAKPSDSSSSDSQSPDSQSSDSPPKQSDEAPTSKDGKNANDSAKEDKPSDSGKNESDGKQQGQPQQGQPQQGQPQQGQPQQGQPQQGQPQQGQPQQGQPQQGQQQQGQQQQGQQQQGQQQQGQGPSEQGEQDGAQEPKEPESKDPAERAKKRIEQARKKMEEAKKALDEAERKGALEKQRQAEDELRSAIEELEEILRQLREEEIERSLASLEARLRKMLDMQNKVLEETKRLQEISGDQAARQVEIRASNLALEQRKILSEGERAFLLLREEGSSAAFPEAMEQVNSDIGNVADRLSKADIGALTTSIEQEIVTALEEMIAALVQVQKDNKEKKKQQQQQQQQQQGEPGDQPLVDKLAELRLIRTLQLRINARTTALAQMLADPSDAIGQATQSDILAEVKKLAERQANIQQVTKNVAQEQ